jgi:hypothetical protein
MENGFECKGRTNSCGEDMISEHMSSTCYKWELPVHTSHKMLRDLRNEFCCTLGAEAYFASYFNEPFHWFLLFSWRLAYYVGFWAWAVLSFNASLQSKTPTQNHIFSSKYSLHAIALSTGTTKTGCTGRTLSPFSHGTSVTSPCTLQP